MWQISQMKSNNKRHSIDPIVFNSREVNIESFLRDEEPAQANSRSGYRSVTAAELQNIFMQYMNANHPDSEEEYLGMEEDDDDDDYDEEEGEWETEDGDDEEFDEEYEES